MTDDKTAVDAADEERDWQDTKRLLGLTGNGSQPDDRPVSRGPLGPADFAHWPVPVGRVRVDEDTTYVYSPEKQGYSADEFLTLPVGDRAELWDGAVVLRPELVVEHRAVVDGLFKELCERCPKGLIPFDGRLDVRVGEATVLRPVIQLLSREGDDPPRVLVVDVIPGRDMWYRARERDVKRHGYLEARIASLWIVDPEDRSVAVYEMKYQKRGEFKVDEVCVKGQWNHWGVWAGDGR
jgi:hypothetical protein